LSNSIKINKNNIRVSKNSKYWYKTALSYDSQHPEANYAYACDLEDKENLPGALKHFQKAYEGGFNTAILGISRVEKKLDSLQDEAGNIEKGNKKRLIIIPLIIILFVLVSYLMFTMFVSFKERDMYKVYNINEVETKIIEQNVWLHRIPLPPEYLSGDSKTQGVNQISIELDSEVKDIIVSSEEYARNNDLLNTSLELFVYYNDRSGLSVKRSNPVAKASLVNGTVTDIYIYPGFKKKAVKN